MSSAKFLTLIGLAAASTIALTAGSARASVILFADNFNRADNLGLNASADGKSGTLGTLNWVEIVSGGNSEIKDNRLKLDETSASGNYATAYVNHNFIDSTIATAGEFTVSVDVFNVGNPTGGTRNIGFTIGNSLANVNAANGNVPTAFPSDFFMGYDATGTKEVKIRLGGAGTYAHQTPINLDAGGTLAARFYDFSNFNATTTVKYQATINGNSFATGSFTWSGTNENYINLYSNFSSDSGRLDNFVVSTVPEPTSLALLGLGGLFLRRRR